MQITFTEPNQWGFFKVKIANFGEISGCTYKTGTKNGRGYAFIALPQHKITNRDGTEKWIGYLSLERKVMDEITAAYQAQLAADAVKQGVKEEYYEPFGEDESIPF